MFKFPFVWRKEIEEYKTRCDSLNNYIDRLEALVDKQKTQLKHCQPRDLKTGRYKKK